MESHSQKSQTHRYVFFFSRKTKTEDSELVYIQEKVKWITGHVLMSIFKVPADGQSCQSLVPDERPKFFLLPPIRVAEIVNCTHKYMDGVP